MPPDYPHDCTQFMAEMPMPMPYMSPMPMSAMSIPMSPMMPLPVPHMPLMHPAMLQFAGMQSSLYPHAINTAAIEQAPKKGESRKRRERRQRAAAKRHTEEIDGCSHPQHDDGRKFSGPILEKGGVGKQVVDAAKCEGPDPYAGLREQIASQDVEQRSKAIAELYGRVAALSFDPHGCYLVQDALKAARNSEKEQLASELHNKVNDCMESPHANYVIQKLVEAVPSNSSGFVFKEIQGMALTVAGHKYGCRLLCRLFEHAEDEAKEELFYELIEHACTLCRDNYGHYVAKAIFEHGTAEQKKQMAQAMHSELALLAQQRNASHAVVEALTHCDDEDKRTLAKILLEDSCMNPPSLRKVGAAQADNNRPLPVSNTSRLAEFPFGRLVLKKLCELDGKYSQMIQDHLRGDYHTLQLTKNGKKALNEFKIKGEMPTGQPAPDAPDLVDDDGTDSSSADA